MHFIVDRRKKDYINSRLLHFSELESRPFIHSLSKKKEINNGNEERRGRREESFR